MAVAMAMALALAVAMAMALALVLAVAMALALALALVREILPKNRKTKIQKFSEWACLQCKILADPVPSFLAYLKYPNSI